MASTVEPTKEKEQQQHQEEEEDSAAAETATEEDTGAPVAPIIKLQEVAVTTGEENEEALLDLKAKLYRFDKEGNQWKERGAGTVKLLKHKETQKVRLVMRQNKTLKICANHLVLPTMTTQEHAGNEKSCVWHAADFADGELKEETFCIRFASVENCKTFREMIEEVAESQGKKAKDTEEGTAAANLIEKLSVESKDQEEKPEGKGTAAANLIEKLSVESKDQEEKPEGKGESASAEEKKEDDEKKEDVGDKK